MRSLLIILAGLGLLALALWLAPGNRRSLVALVFVGFWLASSAANLAVGLSHGYSLREELLVHLFLFGIPASAAAWACWRHFDSIVT